MEKSLWKRLWTYRKTDYTVKEKMKHIQFGTQVCGLESWGNEREIQLYVVPEIQQTNELTSWSKS
jgi:hypothetical protein